MEKTLTITIAGRSPLLTHNPTSMGRSAKKPKMGGGPSIPTPHEEAEMGLYVHEGKWGIPGIAIRNALVKAAGSWSAPGGKKRDKLRPLVSHTMVVPEIVPIVDAKGKPVKTYEIDTRRAVVQRSGILRSRPKFTDWFLVFDLIYDDSIIAGSQEEVQALFCEVLNDAGKRIGIGDYRPEKTGWFGRFEVQR